PPDKAGAGILPVNTPGLPCPLFAAVATCGVGIDGEGGGFVGRAADHTPEDGAPPANRRCESGLRCVGLSIASDGLLETLRAFGMGILKASARAATIAEAVGKRAAGSLARARRITPVSAGGIAGLTSIGAGGDVLICCIMISVGVPP